MCKFHFFKSSNSLIFKFKKMSQIISTVMQQAQEAFEHYRQVSGKNRAIFLETIAEEIEGLKDSLVAIAHQETNLPLPRLQGEIGRTTGQLRMFARLIAEGSWVEASIDTANPDRVPPKPDTRKMLVPIGPVAIFGASNFPLLFLPQAVIPQVHWLLVFQ
jgi:NADP-dependent aldehyde dehydrogenase